MTRRLSTPAAPTPAREPMKIILTPLWGPMLRFGIEAAAPYHRRLRNARCVGTLS